MLCGASRHLLSCSAHHSLDHDPKPFTDEEVGSCGQVSRPSPQSWQVAEPHSSRRATHTPPSGWGNGAAVRNLAWWTVVRWGNAQDPPAPAGWAFPPQQAVPSLPSPLPPAIPKHTAPPQARDCPPCVSSSPCWSKGETYPSHRFKPPGRRVPELLGHRHPDLQRAQRGRGWQTGLALTLQGLACLLLKDKATWPVADVSEVRSSALAGLGPLCGEAGLRPEQPQIAPRNPHSAPKGQTPGSDTHMCVGGGPADGEGSGPDFAPDLLCALKRVLSSRPQFPRL